MKIHHRFLMSSQRVLTVATAKLLHPHFKDIWLDTIHSFASHPGEAAGQSMLLNFALAEIATGSSPDGQAIWLTGTLSDMEITKMLQAHLRQIAGQSALIGPMMIDRNPPDSDLFRRYTLWLESLETPLPFKVNYSGRYRRELRKKRPRERSLPYMRCDQNLPSARLLE